MVKFFGQQVRGASQGRGLCLTQMAPLVTLAGAVAVCGALWVLIGVVLTA